MQHVLERRLRRANHMLSHGRHSIQEVVQQCGFPSRQRLHQAFTEAYGLSPSAWRKQNSL